METNKILHADILDIIFDGRNKQYGAYDLRKTYNRRVVIAMCIMTAICLSAFLSSILGNSTDKNLKTIPLTDVNISSIGDEPPLPQPPPPPPPPPPARPQVQTIDFTQFKIVRDELVTDPPPSQDDLVDSKIGTQNLDGKIDDGFNAPPEEKNTGVVVAPPAHEKDIDTRFTPVEKEAKFPGGPDAWRKYLERNLNASAAQEDGAPVGSYTVKVQFIVDNEGAISNVTAIESPKACPSCAKEAIKIIKKGPHWEPAIQNGRKVIYQAVQFITFQVAEE